MNTRTNATHWALVILAGLSITPATLAGVETGDTLKLTLRGVPNPEQQAVSGEYRVGEGGLRLPLLANRVPVRGMTEDEAAAAVEKAFKQAGIYQNPSVEVAIINGGGQRPDAAVISVGGQVNRAGVVPFRKGLTVVQALQAAGDRNAFGGRNITIFRGKKLIRLDYRKAEHKNFELLPDDTISVEPRGPMELDRG